LPHFCHHLDLHSFPTRRSSDLLMFNDHFPEFGGPPIAEGNWPLTFHLYVPDADPVFAQAVAAGCHVTMPLADQFWGDRYGLVKEDRKSTRLNSSHVAISYAVFC